VVNQGQSLVFEVTQRGHRAVAEQMNLRTRLVACENRPSSAPRSGEWADRSWPD
jgi:hypothetical protein